MDDSLSPKRIELLTQWFEEGIPFNHFMGLTVHTMRRGLAVLRIPWRNEFIGDTGRPALHGGVTSMLLDTTGGAACFSMLDRESDRVSTVDLRVDYLQPGGPGDLLCRAEIVRMGNRVGVTRMQMYCGHLPSDTNAARPIATGQGVYNILRKSGD